jgi:large repetitive protein
MVLGSLGVARPPALLAAGARLIVRPMRAGTMLKAASNLFTVTKTDDTVDGTCDADCSLREAIIAANNVAGADEVLVPAGWYTLTLAGANENLAATGDLDVTDDVTFTGAGAELTVIDADGLDRVFHIHAEVSATITGVRVQHGEVPSSGGDSPEGGGIFCEGTLTISDSVIAENVAGVGGGISNQGVVTILHSELLSNTAGLQGGGLYYEPYSPWTFGVTATISDSLVSGNSAPQGGGVYAAGGGILAVYQSEVISNTATGDGGGLNLLGTRALISATTVAANSATQAGGGIFAFGEVTVTASTLQANIAGSFGGGLHNQVWVNVEGGAITGNQAAVGGGLYNNRLLVMTGTVISGNQAALLGGGLATDHSVTQGPDPGPEWFSATLSQTAFVNNTADMGGGLFVAGTLNLSASSIVSNTAARYGGGLFRAETSPHPVLISATTFMSNTALEGGGINNGAGHMTLQASELRNNWAAEGGGLYNGSYPLTLTRAVTVTESTFEGNSSFAGGGLANGPGAILLVDSSQVVSNTSPAAGGLWNEGQLTVISTTVAYNQELGIGNRGTLTLTHSLLAFNVSQGPGGGLWHEAGGGPSLIQDSRLFSNTATLGGGVYVHSGALRLDRSTLAGNLGTQGGGLHNRGTLTLTLTNVTVSGNQAQFGGGLYQANQAGSQARLNNSTVADNVAGDGGGVYNAGATVDLSNSILATNGASTPDCFGTLATSVTT